MSGEYGESHEYDQGYSDGTVDGEVTERRRIAESILGYGCACSALGSDPRGGHDSRCPIQIGSTLLAKKTAIDHEPAHDRRERDYARRFEDRDGRVEGVDR